MTIPRVARSCCLLLAGTLSFQALPLSALAATADAFTLRGRAAAQDGERLQGETAQRIHADLERASHPNVIPASRVFAPPLRRFIPYAARWFSKAALIFLTIDVAEEGATPISLAIAVVVARWPEACSL